MDWAEFIAECIPSPHTITVEAYAGGGAYGDRFDPPVEVTPCVVEDTRRRVNSQVQDAAVVEVLSSTTVYAPPATVVPAGSRVTLPSGRVSRVIAVSNMDAHGHELPEHCELNLE